MNVMRRSILFFGLLLIASSFIPGKKILAGKEAIVESRNGLGVFIMSEPTHAYKVIFRVRTYHGRSNTVGNVGGINIGVVTGINDPIDRLIRKATRKNKKDKTIDAIITGDCQMAIGIRFNESLDIDQKLAARPSSVQGVDVYVKSKPNFQYTVVAEQKLEMKNRIDVPILDANNFSQMINNIIVKAKKDGKEFDAIITSDGINATLIKY